MKRSLAGLVPCAMLLLCVQPAVHAESLRGSQSVNVASSASISVPTINVDKWIRDRATDFSRYITGRHGLAQPTCGDEGAARTAGVRITSDGGDSVKWCFGVKDGEHILVVANNRRTFAQVTYPSAWKARTPASFSASYDGINRSLGGVLANLVEPRGTASKIIDGGDILTLVLPPGAGGSLSIQASFVTWALSAIEFGMETYAMVAKGAPGSTTVAKTTQGSWQRVLDGLSGVSPLGATTDAVKQCFRSAGDYFTGPVTKTVTRNDVLKFAGMCVPKIMQADLAGMGVHGVAAGTVTAAVGAAVTAILTAVNLLVTSMREVWDAVASFGGRSDPLYDIKISTAVGPAGFAAPDAPASTSWSWESVMPSGQVFSRGVGSLQVTSRVLSSSSQQNVTYRVSESFANNGPDSCWANRAYEGVSSHSLYLFNNGARVQGTETAPPLGLLTFVGPLSSSECIQGGVQTNIVTYTGQATFRTLPADRLVNEPLAAMTGWFNNFGNGTDNFTLTTSFHVAGDPIQTTR